jgi:trigger factor
MHVTATPAPKSSVQLEIEVPPERLDRAIRDSVGRLARRQRIPGFRPGKAPRPIVERVIGPGAVLDDAVDHLVQDAYRQAIIDQQILPLTNADVEILEAEEGKPVRFKATVQVRPQVKLGDYKAFNFKPEIEGVDDAKVDKVIEELRDQNATLAAVEDRGLADGDYAIVGFEGTIDGQPFEGGSAERLPMVVGQERVLPGFQDQLKGMKPDETREFDLAFPTGDEIEEQLRGKTGHFTVTLKELRQKVLPELDDDFAQGFGDFADLAALRVDIARRLERNAIDAARHAFADRIIEYAVANATLELPDILVDQEVEVMHDEFRATLARQGIAEQAYLQATGQSDADLHTEFRPRAEQRTKTLLVLTEIARAEGIDVPQADIEAEVDKARSRYTDQKVVKYFESERGRDFIRSTLRRTRVVEGLVDEWLAAHPEHPPLLHLEDQDASPVDAPEAHAAASIGATDPGAIPGAPDDSPAEATATATTAGRKE